MSNQNEGQDKGWKTNGKRKLAAILFTDIVGYSAISHRNEALALDLLEEHREIIRPLIEKHHGKEIKTIGDAFLVEFKSALDGTLCAIDIQNHLGERNLAQPRERRLLVRASVHLGDIIEHEGDVYGDGVNVAARLLHYASRGGISISQSVADQVRGHVETALIPIGSKQLRNIAKTIEIFRIYPSQYQSPRAWPKWYRTFRSAFSRYGMAACLAAGMIAILITTGFAYSIYQNISFKVFPRLSLQKRIAVIPTRVLASEKTQVTELLAEGISDLLLSRLSRAGEFKVLSRTSVENFLKQQSQNLSNLHSELQVTHYLETTLQPSPSSTGLRVQLVEAKTGDILWSRDLKTSKNQNLLNLQDQLSNEVMVALQEQFMVRIADGEPTQRLEDQIDQPSYLAYLSAKYKINQRTRQSIEDGINGLQAILKQNPKFGEGYGLLASAYSLLGYYGFLNPGQSNALVTSNVNRALELSPHSPEALLALAEKQVYYDHAYKGAELTYLKAIEYGPNLPHAYHWFGEFLTSQGRFDEARTYFKKAVSLDPLSPLVHVASTLPEYYSGAHTQAIKVLRRVTEMEPSFFLGHLWLGRNLAQTRDFGEAIENFRTALKVNPQSDITRGHLAQALLALGTPEGNKEGAQITKELLSRSKHQYVPAYAVAVAIGGGKRTDLALSWLEKVYEERSDYYVHLSRDPFFKAYLSEPRFIGLIHKASLNRATASAP